MQIQISTSDILNGQNTGRFTIELPPICPNCIRGIFPKVLEAYFNEANSCIKAVCFCPACENLFITDYPIDYGFTLGFKKIIPLPSRTKKFTDNIEKISPDFCKIYNEAYKAEQQELFEICGMGYRKALEFLIKDYALSLNPNDKEDISKKPLSKCITDHLDSADLKALAIASAWIGNEETHYVRTMTNYGLEDLKTFINAAVSFIDMKLNISKANSLINSRPNSLKK